MSRQKVPIPTEAAYKVEREEEDERKHDCEDIFVGGLAEFQRSEEAEDKECSVRQEWKPEQDPRIGEQMRERGGGFSFILSKEEQNLVKDPLR